MSFDFQLIQSNPLVQDASRHAFDKLMRYEGQVISRDPISSMQVVEAAGRKYFLKRYIHAGKYLRKFVGRSRARAEFENLQRFKSLDIPTADVILFAERRRGLFKEACLLTTEIPGTDSLLALHQQSSDIITTDKKMRKVLAQIADYTKRLHAEGFIHIDLKWRNILLQKETLKVFFIDCPQGHIKRFQFNRGRIKDLACLDKVGRYALTRTQRLFFLKQYLGISKLASSHKELIKRVLLFFEGRE